ncbi:hypothetical protein, partial [Comamonas sp.]|uniref:hypothetical protein n=1 Tax=Comamonas sp. TaxID=34028 RepID=UPI002FC7F4E0
GSQCPHEVGERCDMASVYGCQALRAGFGTAQRFGFIHASIVMNRMGEKAWISLNSAAVPNASRLDHH